MAIMKCRECGGQVSTSAKACPTCGAKAPKKTSLTTWVVGGIFAFIVGGAVIDSAKKADAPPAKKEPTQADREINAAIGIAKALKASMKNPASFKLEGFLIFPGGATCYDYRATNSFNAVVPGRAVYLPATGKVLTQDQNGNQFVKAWNDTCTKSGGQERAAGINALGAV